MHQNISLNGGVVGVASAYSTCMSTSVLYGKGIFTTIRVMKREPLFWEMHWRRLSNNAAKVGIELGDHTERSVRQALGELLETNAVADGRARVTFVDESASDVWPFETGRKTGLLIMTGDLRPRTANLSLSVSPYRINSRSPLAGVKSCNYMEKILALNEAKGRGYGEAVQTDERGNVSSACMANVFWVAGGELFTPALTTGCIAGTTREYVMENLRCREVEAGIESLQAADAIFLASAGIGVRSVSECDGRSMPQRDHPILSLID